MAWARLDDQFFYNKKIAQVDGPAKLLYIAGLVYVANQLTDGFIPERAVKFIASTADVANCQEFASQLLDVGLWDATDGGYQIHDFLAWNPSREQVQHTREARAQSGRRGGLAKAANAKQDASNLPSKPLANDKQKSAPSPSPSLNSPANAGEAAPAKPSKRDSKSKPPDESMLYPAVQVYRDLAKQTPAQVVRENIGQTVTDLDQWRKVIAAWLGAGYKPGNVNGMLEWYTAGIPQHRSNSNGNLAKSFGLSSLSGGAKAPEPTAEFLAEWNRLNEPERTG